MIEAERVGSPEEMVEIMLSVENLSPEELATELELAEEAFLGSTEGSWPHRYYNWYANLLTMLIMEHSGIPYL